MIVCAAFFGLLAVIHVPSWRFLLAAFRDGPANTRVVIFVVIILAISFDVYLIVALLLARPRAVRLARIVLGATALTHGSILFVSATDLRAWEVAMFVSVALIAAALAVTLFLPRVRASIE
jgi:hypothetical protein